MIKQANIVPDISGLDLGISFQELSGLHPDFRLKFSRQLSPADAKIKSWHDEMGSMHKNRLRSAPGRFHAA
jgi:hypothetical protein